jgi:hypothetical protein
LFESEAQRQYVHTLQFSDLTGLVSGVVLGKYQSMNAGYKALKDQLGVSVRAVYDKLQGVELGLSRQLVRNSYRQTIEICKEIGCVQNNDLAGYSTRILDGNWLSGTEHRLKETRTSTAAPLPGKSLVVYDPRYRAACDFIPIEDAYSQELSGLDAVIDTLAAKQLWLADRNFCTLKFLYSIAAKSGCFVIRQHSKLHGTEKGKGPEVWDIQWHTCYRKTHDGKLVSKACTLIVATNIRTGEVKYFLSNRVPGRGGWTSRDLLRIGFGRWKVEVCFREAKEELGWDHFECRGWICVHRHLTVTILAQMFCARVRHQRCRSEVITDAERLTLEQVRRAADVFIASSDHPPRSRRKRYQAEHERIQYQQTRNTSASVSHRKRRYDEYRAIGIDPDRIKSVEEKPA